MPAGVRIKRLWRPEVSQAALDDAMAETGAEIRKELMGDQFARSRWVYAGINPRPTYSPAEQQWRSIATSRGVRIENPATNRQGRPYVGWIHYAGTPRRPTVWDATVRARKAAWVKFAGQEVVKAILRGWRHG